MGRVMGELSATSSTRSRPSLLVKRLQLGDLRIEVPAFKAQLLQANPCADSWAV